MENAEIGANPSRVIPIYASNRPFTPKAEGNSRCPTAYFWQEPVLELWAALNVILIILPVVAFFSSRRVHRFLVVGILFFVILFVFVDVSILVPDVTAQVCVAR